MTGERSAQRTSKVLCGHRRSEQSSPWLGRRCGDFDRVTREAWTAQTSFDQITAANLPRRRCANGSESWLKILYIKPDGPWENGYKEIFKGELLNSDTLWLMGGGQLIDPTMVAWW